jgi:hypothetical protein
MPELEAVIGEDGALEPITGFAKTIDELARRIESALQEALDRALVAVQLEPAGGLPWHWIPARMPGSAEMTTIITRKEPP